MNIIRTLCYLLLLVTIPLASLNAYDMKNVIAYPVPFNPKKDVLKIGEPDTATTLPVDCSLKIVIYDINGDIVRTLNGNGHRIAWNGRDEGGRYVKPGLYIIKITAEFSDFSNNDYGKKIIRILVDY